MIENPTEEQRAILDVVRDTNDDVRVTALAGSGKTSTLIAALGVIKAPSVLMTAFNKRIAETLMQKIANVPTKPVVHVKTFHALGLSILKHHHSQVQVNGSASDDLVNASCKGAVSFKIRRAAVRLLRSVKEEIVTRQPLIDQLVAHGHAKNLFSTRDGLLLDSEIEHVVDIAYAAYTRGVKFRDRAEIDFCDMVWGPIVNDLAPPSRYKAVIVDEMQDISSIQLALIKRVIAPGGRLIGIGDRNQCIPKGELVQTPDGPRPIETIEAGAQVLASMGGEMVACTVLRRTMTPHKKAYEFDLGEHGKFRATANHTCFAAISAPEGAYLYLMFREGFGYRIGVTRKTGEKRGSSETSILARTLQEQADRMWILGWFPTYAAAAEVETRLSLKHGVPKEPFVPRLGTWTDSASTQRLFAEFGKNGTRLLEDFGLKFEQPIYAAKGRHDRLIVNLLLATKQGHRVEVETATVSPELRARLEMSRTEKGTWRVRRQFRDLSTARTYANRLASELQAGVIETLSGLERRMFATPAAGIHCGMVVPVTEGGITVLARVLKRTEVDVDACFDLEVDRAANFVVGNAIVHNCIYNWRNAEPDKVWAEFDARGARELPLTTCFRCPVKVLDCAREFVPSIRPRDGAPEGEVHQVSAAQALELLKKKANTFVLSRSNAMLFSFALRAWSAGVKFTLNAGMEMLDPLFAVLTGLKTQGSMQEFSTSLTEWFVAEMERANKANSSDWATRLEEQHSMLAAVATHTQRPSLIARLIRDMIDANGSQVLLSSVHKVKGLEADRVFLLKLSFARYRPRLPGREEEPIEQEELNIEYVGVTRAIQSLYWVT